MYNLDVMVIIFTMCIDAEKAPKSVWKYYDKNNNRISYDNSLKPESFDPLHICHPPNIYINIALRTYRVILFC